MNHAVFVNHRLTQKIKRLIQRAQRVGGQCAHWRDPQHGERRRRHFCISDICYFFNS